MQIFYCDFIAIYKYNLSRITNLVIRDFFKINKRLAIYCIVFYGILIGIKNTKTVIYKCIVGNGVIDAGKGDVDAVVADIVAG